MELTRKLCGEDFDILSGDDDKTYTMMISPDIEASGVISVISNVAPGALSDMVHYILDGNNEAAAVIQQALQPLFGISHRENHRGNTIWTSSMQSTQSTRHKDPHEHPGHALRTMQTATGQNDPPRHRSRLSHCTQNLGNQPTNPKAHRGQLRRQTIRPPIQREVP